MWSSLKSHIKENVKDFFKVNGTAAGAIGASELGGLDWVGMSEVIQSLTTTGIVLVILAYNVVKSIQLYRQMIWEQEDRRNGRRSEKSKPQKP